MIGMNLCELDEVGNIDTLKFSSLVEIRLIRGAARHIREMYTYL